ncbi:UDP-glycosyltransferase 83A1-like [Salvia miltiorrhiza]|uniref:UDP-glycosyltransferase 83A1-like n=1 Tax=Salvia miltiorrhiza TaxID=226208 RepID=UPI0025ACA72F|nr:UDP-glycosyltransferase 83A1-like [Salvia miltiorrhiza]
MAALSGKKPHVMAVAVPGQGHITPLMNLCREIAKRGIKVTFVNARTIHEKLVAAAEDIDDYIALASVPDEIIPDIHPNEPFKLLASLRKTMPLTLPDLIESINNSNPDQKISCIIVDLALGWIVEIAQKMGIEPVGFSVVSMADTAIILQSPKLLEGGIVDTHGISSILHLLSDDIPPWRKNELPWSSSSDEKIRKKSFEIVMEFRAANQVKWLICNSCYELEPAAYGLYPNFLPLGLFHQSETKSNSGSLLPADSSCLSWLDTKPDGSVIYVSFGSLASFSQQQMEELATGLELSGRPFLWVIRRDLAAGSPLVYPDGFLERVSVLGKIVEWAPQNEILSHPAIACFLSHCGWNSTLEGVSKGVPFLCWACFADQFHNESFICDMWEIGLRIDLDEFGSVRSKHEIKKKIDMIFWSDKFKENALKLKELCAKSIREGGSTYKYFEMFIDYLKNTTTHL